MRRSLDIWMYLFIYTFEEGSETYIYMNICTCSKGFLLLVFLGVLPIWHWLNILKYFEQSEITDRQTTLNIITKINWQCWICPKPYKYIFFIFSLKVLFKETMHRSGSLILVQIIGRIFFYFSFFFFVSRIFIWYPIFDSLCLTI